MTYDVYFEYRLHTANTVQFNLKCLKCGKYLTIKHKNIEVVSNENKPYRWKIGSNIREEDLQDKSNYNEIFHRHTKRCSVSCIAFLTKNIAYSKVGTNKR